MIAVYNQIFPELVIGVDGVERRWPGYEDWVITTTVDSDAYWETTLRAIACHASQLVGFENFERMAREQHTVLLGQQNFYRAYSLVNAGRQRESDLFEGLR
jgi:LmbE family N-acetylglucosaminyl deacetylase